MSPATQSSNFLSYREPRQNLPTSGQEVRNQPSEEELRPLTPKYTSAKSVHGKTTVHQVSASTSTRLLPFSKTPPVGNVPQQQESKMASMPIDTWILTLELMANGEDRDTLFRVAQTCHTFARHALPLLYEHCDFLDLLECPDEWTASMSIWWRSIIMSTRDRTFQPYCVFVKILNFGDLYRLLHDVAEHTRGVQDSFFGPPLQALKIQSGRRLDIRAIILHVASLLTEKLRAAGEANDMPRLATLVVQEGVVPSSDLALVIRKACPRFKKLVCDNPTEYLRGGHDTKMAKFVQNLAPNSLVTFDDYGPSNVGPETIQALRGHSMSLRHLELQVLKNAALRSLPLLGPCLNLESLDFSSYPDATQIGSQVAKWMKQLVSLKNLTVNAIPNGSEIVQDALRGSEIKLKSLRIFGPRKSINISAASYQDKIRLFDEIAKQTTLQTLHLLGDEDVFEALDMAHPLNLAFANTLVHLTALRKLIIAPPISYPTLVSLTRSCPYIDHLSFASCGPEDGRIWLKATKRFRSLKYLNWKTESSFTTGSVLHLFKGLANDPLGCHRGFIMRLDRQAWPARFSEGQMKVIRAMLCRLLGGSFYVTHMGETEHTVASDSSESNDDDSDWASGDADNDEVLGDEDSEEDSSDDDDDEA